MRSWNRIATTKAVFLGVFDESNYLAAFIRLIASPTLHADNEFHSDQACSDRINKAGTGNIASLR
jgi:hypothetical protein